MSNTVENNKKQKKKNSTHGLLVSESLTLSDPIPPPAGGNVPLLICHHLVFNLDILHKDYSFIFNAQDYYYCLRFTLAALTSQLHF